MASSEAMSVCQGCGHMIKIVPLHNVVQVAIFASVYFCNINLLLSFVAPRFYTDSGFDNYCGFDRQNDMSRWISKPKKTMKAQSVRRSLEGRLAKIEQELAQVEANERLNNCICDNKLVVVTAGMAAEFRAGNRLCPVHGFREMDIMHVTVCRTQGSPPPTPD